VVTPFLSPWYLLWAALYAAVLAEGRTIVLTALLCFGGATSYWAQFIGRPAFNLTIMESGTVGLATIAAPFLLGLAVMAVRERWRGSASPAAAPSPAGQPILRG
jgi:hypothetical protein